MHAEIQFGLRHRGQIAVLRLVHRIKEALLDVGVRHAEIDIHHIRRYTAGHGQQFASDAFHLYAGKAVQFDFDIVPVVPSVFVRIRLIFLAVLLRKYFRKAPHKLFYGGRIRAGGVIGPAGIGEIEQLYVDDGFPVKVLNPTALRGAGRAEKQDWYEMSPSAKHAAS